MYCSFCTHDALFMSFDRLSAVVGMPKTVLTCSNNNNDTSNGGNNNDGGGNNFSRSCSSPDLQKVSECSIPGTAECSKGSQKGSVSFESVDTHNRISTPRVQLNGSLLSISNAHLMDSATRFMDYTRKLSVSSQHSDSRRNLLLQNVGRTLQRTHSHLKRTRLLHAFYLLALPVYTIVGAVIFQALDGHYDDLLKQEYEQRCLDNRAQQLDAFQLVCQTSGPECFKQMANFLYKVENCYREWHRVNRTITHPMSDFTNAVIYAFSVYTTIGYGNISANTVGCRIATVLYGICGIPLFFAFIKEEGNQGRMLFIWIYRKIKERQSCCGKKNSRRRVEKTEANAGNQSTIAVLVENTLDSRATSKPVVIKRSSNDSFHPGNGGVTGIHSTSEQRRVFLSGIIVFIVYMFSISALFSYMTEWDYFTAFYFLFNSVALIGFGDVFPPESRVILVNMIFIVTGVVLFSMCYFILQEEIREKAFEASRKARMSISKYSQSLMLHTKNPWSRRNSPAFDNRSPVSEASAFDHMRKRRQSAPVVTLNDTKTLLSFSR